MTDPRSSAVLPILIVLCAPLLVTQPVPGWAEARVEARLSSQELPSPQPVELSLSASVSDGAPSTPDLSPLEPDFQILDRRVERRVSVTNGRRQEEVRLRLMLLPRRAGELDIPALTFGSARTQPLRLVVKGESPALGSAPEIPGTPTNRLLDPGSFEPPGMAMPAPSAPETYPDWVSSPLWDPIPGWRTFTPPTAEPKPAASPPEREPVAPAASPSKARPSEASSGTFGNPWFWISLALGVILAMVLGLRHRPLRSPSSERSPGAAGQELVEPDPLEIAVETVRAAYVRGDGNGARAALLTWGRLRWPEDPPGNLARLAGRCPPPLREHITQLEKAFFSPSPIHWEQEPVPEELRAQSPPRIQGVAAA
jgi:BatD DUF11 like domain